METERKRTVEMRNLEDHSGAVTPSDYTSQVQLIIKRDNQMFSTLPRPTSCEEETRKTNGKINVNQRNTQL